jgi:maleylacetate reductase
MKPFTYTALPSRVVFGAEADLERAAKIALEAPYPNPAPISYDGVLALLKRAHAGVRPD